MIAPMAQMFLFGTEIDYKTSLLGKRLRLQQPERVRGLRLRRVDQVRRHVMRRRQRAPTTQLARAGERTRILISDSPIAEVKFKATCLTGDPTGTVHLETVDGGRTEPLAADNRLNTDGLISMSVVPEADTAITFQPPDRPSNPVVVALGALFLTGALLWTGWDLLGL